ncbi:MAG: hypothetical protein H7Z42_05380 [Roseiflexaceae bacterium]|nr:hypothetical protein [Roseiflexaceae bacterium]
MDTDDMARRGSEDAELGKPNPFYYQHYYYYRRSYDRASRRFQRPLWKHVALISACIAMLASLFAVVSGRFSPPTQEAEAGIVVVAATSTATPRPLFPTPTPLPPTQTPFPTDILAVGGFASVSNTAGGKLRGRAEAGFSGAVQVSFAEGARVQIVEGPVEADGMRWWRIESEVGSGWSAERSADGPVWLVPIP